MYVTMRQTEWPAAAAFLPEYMSGAYPTPSIRAGCTPELQRGPGVYRGDVLSHRGGGQVPENVDSVTSPEWLDAKA